MDRDQKGGHGGPPPTVEALGLNIGNAFLKDFVLTIDYGRKLLALERP